MELSEEMEKKLFVDSRVMITRPKEIENIKKEKYDEKWERNMTRDEKEVIWRQKNYNEVELSLEPIR